MAGVDWVKALICLLALQCLHTSQAAKLQGIVATPGEGLADTAGAESSDSIECLAVIYPYSTWEPTLNSSSRQPTSSPVPPFVEGSIDFSIVNTGSNTIQAPWTLGVYNPQYTQVIQVCPHSWRKLPHNCFTSLFCVSTPIS